MPKVRITGGKKAAQFTFGIVYRDKVDIYDVPEKQMPSLDFSLRNGRISSYELVTDAAPKAPRAEEVASETQAADDSSPKKPLEDYSRDELKEMYKAVTGEEAGKRKTDFLIKELRNALNS